MSLPSIVHPTGQANFSAVSINGVTYFFSYETCVAFERYGVTYVRQNEWSTTTGKHLNTIDGGSPEAKKQRLAREDFLAALAAL